MEARMVYLILFLLLGQPAIAQPICFGDCETAMQQVQGRNPMAGMMAKRRIMNGMVGNCSLPALRTTTMNGGVIDSALLQDKVVVLNFWFTTCPPCIKELPALNRLTEEYAEEEVVFLAMGRDDEEEVGRFLQEYAFQYQQVTDIQEKGLIDEFCVFAGFPTNMVFDREGILQHISVGGNPDQEMEKYHELQPVIEAALKK